MGALTHKGDIIGGEDVINSNIANANDAYDSTKAYALGDLCIYNNVLYRCITACSAGSWATNQSCFTQDTLVNAVDRLSNIEIIPITFKNSAYNRGERTRLIKYGNLMILMMEFYLNNIGNTDTIAISFASNYAPANIIKSSMINNNREQCIGSIDSSGNLTLTGASGTLVFGLFTWVIGK